MAETGVEIKMYLDHVEVTVEEASEEVLKQLALRIVERTQLNIRENDQIDTGFMVNSTYPIWKDGSGFEEAQAEASAKAPDREMINEPLEAEASAGVVVGANYAIYQENLQPFLYPASEAAAAEFGGEAEKIFREVLPDEGPRA
jgi:hypothetical protein